jgi:hypothetical protein
MFHVHWRSGPSSSSITSSPSTPGRVALDEDAAGGRSEAAAAAAAARGASSMLSSGQFSFGGVCGIMVGLPFRIVEILLLVME